MPYEMLIALNVTDNHKYEKYRTEMKPILRRYGGRFSSDFKISEVMLPESNKDVNRVFTIYFSDKKSKEQFFADPDYLKVKKHFFDSSVKSVTIISGYEKESL